MYKNKLFKKYNFLPTREMRAGINEIIAENRNISLEKAKYKKIVRPIEISLFLEFFGIEK